jgi:hypothetical protein
MANEADPDSALAGKNVFPGRIIALSHVGLNGNLEIQEI